MNAWPLTILLPLVSCMPCAAIAGQQEGAAEAPSAASKHSARPSPDAIARAVRETLAELPEQREPAGKALSGDSYTRFERAFSQAEKPNCLGPDAMKHQPHSAVIGNWQFGAGGLLALPFWGAAIARGKCKWGD